MDYKEIFYKDSVEKQVTIKSDDGLIDIGNGDFDGETMELTESVCDKDELTFGACSAAQLSFTVSGGFSLQGKWLNVDIGLKSEDAFASPYRLGRYKVNSDKPTADRTSRKVIAYDALYDILQTDVAGWYNTILPGDDSRVYLRDFRDSFFNHFGIEQEDITLVNDDMWVEKTVKAGELSGAAVINCICEINGCMGHIDRAGKFEYIYLEPISAPDDISKSLYTSAAYEDYIVQPIDKLQIRQEDDDIGVIVGDGSNSYIIEDNFLVYGKSSAELTYIANNIFTKIKGLAYRPFTVECIGNPCIPVGAPVRVISTYATIDSYVFTRTLKGVQSLSDTYAAAGNEHRTGKVNSIQRQIIQLKGRSNVLSQTIEETRNTISDIEQGLKNEITATASEFDVKLRNLQSEIDGQIEVINGHGQPALDNYPAYNWTSGPRTGDKLVEGLRFTYSNEVYRKHQRTLFFDEATATTYRFIKKDDVWIWEPLGNTEYSVLQKQITDLTADEASVALSKLETKVGSDYITKVESQASIKLVQDSLTTQFVKTYATLDKLGNYSTTAEMYTTISESAEGIKRTVAASSSKWDCGSYDGVISYYEYGDPWENGYKAVDKFLNQYYLDVSNGCIYYCHYINGHDGEIDWKAVYNCKITYTQLKTRAEQLESKFSWLVKSGDSESNMVLTDRLYELVTEHIDLTGLVTISSLKESGQTIINADNILTGTIKAVTIEGCNITGSAIAFANDSGGWNSVLNSEGMWIIGNGTLAEPDFQVDKWGFLRLGGRVKMNPAGVWWADNAGTEHFKSWSEIMGF